MKITTVIKRLGKNKKYNIKLKREASEISSSIYFDEVFYRIAANIDDAVDAAEHYCRIGWRAGLNPSPYFDTRHYRAQYRDVSNSDANPLIHYIRHGAAEKRQPSPNFDVPAFTASHPEAAEPGVDAAAFCLRLYGRYQSATPAQIFTAPPSQAGWRSDPDIVAQCRTLFDENFYVSTNDETNWNVYDPFEHYMDHGYGENRDPSPDFDTQYYRRRYLRGAQQDDNPLLHYVNFGNKAGYATHPAHHIVLENIKIIDKINTSICLHIHCYYPEIFHEFLPGLRNLPSSAYIVVTAVTQADVAYVENLLRRERLPQSYEVRAVANIGRDLKPFLVDCADIWSRFDIVGHLHTKLSPHIAWGTAWRRYLIDSVLGDATLVARVVSAFAADEKVGVVYPSNYFQIKKFMEAEHNSRTIDEFLKAHGISLRSVDLQDFPAGSMAWYRTKVLLPLAEILKGGAAFEEEAGHVEGTFAHALERIIGLFIAAKGYRPLRYATKVRHRLPPSSIQAPPMRNAGAPIAKRWPRDTPLVAREEPVPLRPRYRRHDARSLNIHWIIPSFGSPGAGGHMSIFRMVRLLETFGHRQTIWLQNAVHFKDQAHAKSVIREWYQPIGDRVNVLFLPDDTRQISGDVLIATDCWTAFPAATASAFQERFYFVQDYEPAFYPAGEIQQVAELTYEFGFSCLAAGRWLQQLMEERGIWVRAWDLAVDHDIYFPRPRLPGLSQTLKIAFYARGYTPRRAVRLGIAALNDLVQRLPGIEVHLFGQDDLDVSEIQFPFVNHGVLSSEGLSDLYRSSDIGIVFSATNYSLVPLEMMACGLPLVELDVPSTRAVFSGDEVSLAKPVPSAIAACIEALAKDPAKRAAQVAAGLAYVSGLSWETSARRVEAALLERLEQVGSRAIEAETVLERPPALVTRKKASVVIPSYNAGEAFGPVLDMLARQSCDFAYDVLVVDSGSRDQTCDLVRRYADRGIRLETIPNSEFQHGRTRNYAISQTEGEYVAVLTQDARPKDEHWLANLVGGFAKGPRVAGVIGRHEAYPEHDPFTRRDMKEHFDQLALMSPVVSLDVGLPSWIHPGSVPWWATLMFYSDNNSAMARAVWKEIPYPEVEWGEDQVWAFEMLKLGFQKAYVDDAVVYHSHEFSAERQFSVSATEGAFWAEEFGISLHPDEVGAITGMKHRDEAYATAQGISREALTRRLALNNATVRGRQAGNLAKTTRR